MFRSSALEGLVPNMHFTQKKNNYSSNCFLMREKDSWVLLTILFLPPYTRSEKKNIWSELELNPGPFTSKATALYARPWLLKQLWIQVDHFHHIQSVSTFPSKQLSWKWREKNSSWEITIEANDHCSHPILGRNTTKGKTGIKERNTKQSKKEVQLRVWASSRDRDDCEMLFKLG